MELRSGTSTHSNFKLNNLITKLQWIASDKDRVVQPHSTLTPEEASMILSYMPEPVVTGVVDRKAYELPYEDG